jgi:DNA-3-methyladenine glycosylase
MNIDDYEKLPRSFYVRPDVVQIARDLIGKYIFSLKDNRLTAGRIVESEAYDGRKDKACHAFLKRTRRTDIMYHEGGCAYVYLCYGIHHMFNIVTNKEGMADAILIRAVEPLAGEEIMLERRKGNRRLTNGPGLVTQALNIRREDTGIDLTGNTVYLASNKNGHQDFEIIADRRVGIDYAAEDALLPWRFFEANNPWVSKQTQKPLKLGYASH